MSAEARLTLLEVVVQAPSQPPRQLPWADPRIPLLRDDEDVPNLVLLRRARFYVAGATPPPAQPTPLGRYQPRILYQQLQAQQDLEEADYALKLIRQAYLLRLNGYPFAPSGTAEANLTLLEVVVKAPVYWPPTPNLAARMRLGAADFLAESENHHSMLQLRAALRRRPTGGTSPPPPVSGRRYVWFIS